MYRINDKAEAVRQVQIYLNGINNTFVMPSGVYDENTRIAVIGYQRSHGLEPTGTVDRATFDSIYKDYVSAYQSKRLYGAAGSFISFPIREGDMSPEIIHLNRTLENLLCYYGITHRLRCGSFYSSETAEAVRVMRRIYLLADGDYVDEELYLRMMADRNSIKRLDRRQN